MDQELIFTIAGAFVLLVIILVFLLTKRKKKRKKKQAVTQPTIASKYNSRAASEEELESASRLKLISFKDGVNALFFRFEVNGTNIKLDDIEPYDNDWGFVHNYSEIIGKNHQNKHQFRIFFNRRKRKKANVKEAFDINFIYRDHAGAQWLQGFRYNSQKGVKAKDVQVLEENTTV